MEVAVEQVVPEYAPHTIIIGGDTWNFDIISRWQNRRRKRLDPYSLFKKVKEEIAVGQRLIEGILEAAPQGCRVIVLEGNHCDRLRKYISDDLQEGWDTAYSWLGIEELGVTYLNRSGFYLRPDYKVKHGDYATEATAKKEFKEEGTGGASGHKHTDQKHVEFYPDSGKYFEWRSKPCMCALDANYRTGNAGRMRWIQGVTVGEYSTRDPYDYNTDVGRWTGDRLHLRGKVYR